MKSLLCIVLLLASSACMTKPNPAFRPDGDECTTATEETDCTEPSAPICDTQGQCRGCGGDTECEARDPNFPICVEGACLSRCTEGPDGDATCADRDATKPYCVGEACVECRSDVDCTGGLACIEAAGRCEMCTAHSDCDTGACDRDSGTCAAEADIIYVDQNDAAADDAGTCESAAPCETIGGAIALIAETRNVIIVRGDETVFYDGVLTLDGITATLIGSGANIQPSAGEMNTAVITISNGADVSIEGFTITLASGNANADGIRCNGVAGTEPTLQLQSVTIKNNDGTGVDAVNCTAYIRRNNISNNTLGGVRLYNCAFHVTNNFIANNGNIAVNPVGGVIIDNVDNTDQIERVFSFNTVTGNQAIDAADSKGVRCRSDNAVTATGNIVHSNLGNAPTISGTCNWEYSNIEGGITGTSNIDNPPSFVDAAGGDFHLQPESPGVDVTGLTSDILVDIEGDTRPQNNLFDMGADEVVPQ